MLNATSGLSFGHCIPKVLESANAKFVEECIRLFQTISNREGKLPNPFHLLEDGFPACRVKTLDQSPRETPVVRLDLIDCLYLIQEQFPMKLEHFFRLR